MNLFLLRWNPAISSWKDANFREAIAKSRNEFIFFTRINDVVL